MKNNVKWEMKLHIYAEDHNWQVYFPNNLQEGFIKKEKLKKKYKP